MTYTASGASATGTSAFAVGARVASTGSHDEYDDGLGRLLFEV